MSKNTRVKIFIVIFLVIILIFNLDKFIGTLNENSSNQINNDNSYQINNQEQKFSSNLINDINYISEDKKGNKYILNAYQGEIDSSMENIIFLKGVKATVKMKNSKIIEIVSDFGKYDINNFDTIFSKNVIIKYLDNQINSDYLDFSLVNNKMIISKNVVYKNSEINLKADVIDADIKTNNLKIYMHENKKKVIFNN